MSKRWAVRERRPGGELLSWHGRVLVHGDRAEMEFLLTGEIRIVECPASIPSEDTLELRHHPQFAHHRFPIRREDYR